MAATRPVFTPVKGSSPFAAAEWVLTTLALTCATFAALTCAFGGETGGDPALSPGGGGVETVLVVGAAVVVTGVLVVLPVVVDDVVVDDVVVTDVVVFGVVVVVGVEVVSGVVVVVGEQ